MLVIAVSNCGRAENTAIRMFLHSALSIVNDDMWRAPNIAMSLVFSRLAKMLPHIFSLPAKKFHGHIWYVAAMEIVVACIDTRKPVAVALLDKFTSDAS